MSEMSEWNEDRSSPLAMDVLDFRHVDPFQNQSASNATGVKKKQNLIFDTIDQL